MLSLPAIAIIGILSAVLIPDVLRFVYGPSRINAADTCCAPASSNTIDPSLLSVEALGDTQLLLQRARYYRRSKKFDSALLDIQAALARDSHCPRVYGAFASVYLDMDSLVTSIQAANKALSIAPADTRALFTRIIAYRRANRQDSALADAQLLNRLCPHNPCVLNELGHISRARGDLQKAVDYFSEAIALRPNIRGFYGNRAGAYRAMGDMASASNDAAVYRTLPDDELVFQ